MSKSAASRTQNESSLSGFVEAPPMSGNAKDRLSKKTLSFCLTLQRSELLNSDKRVDLSK